MTASYAKLKSGDWGIRVQGNVKAGQTITVRKKDGTTKQETVVKVVWSGNGISLCAIEQRQTAKASSSRGGSYRSSHPRTGCSCGSREGLSQDNDCWTCRHDAE